MEVLSIALLVLFLVFAPIALSIVAIVKVSNLRIELRNLRRQLSADTTVESRPEPKPIPVPKKPIEPQVAPILPPQGVKTPPLANPKKPSMSFEFLMGGKAAAFAGIAILVMGIAFLVGYAIQHSWMGPGARVVLGLLAGGALVGVGHFVGNKDEKYTLFARVLTGGGSALFYFTVFAAYAFYHLIGPVVAGAGLFASALAVFGLAMVYRAQSVAVLGVLGAFITPLLIGGDMDAGVFPLVYVALVNVPVLLLGVRRKWQVLYNLAFIFTVIHYLVWLDWVGDSELWSGLGFAVLFFSQYAVLGLLKLRCEQRVSGRSADMIRLVASSFLLLGAVYYLLDDAGNNQWIGGAFLLLALLHVALAQFAYKRLTRFNGEILSFLAGGLVFATLALPAQLDGEWVSLGWAIEGVMLAWFACRVQSRVLQAGAFVLGLTGIMKGLIFDVTLYTNVPDLFLNARFLVGMLSALLLGVQGHMASRYPEEETTQHWRDAIWWTGVIGLLLVFFADAFWSLGPYDAYCWLVTSLMLLATGSVVVLFAPPKSTVTILGSILLLLVPAKILLIDSLFGFGPGGAFSNAVIWVQLAVMGIIILALQPRLLASGSDFVMPAPILVRVLNLISLAAGIGIVTFEILRKRADWADMAVTIFWAVCALALILFGMKRRNAAHRYFGLVLFGLATLKVLLVDSSELRGLERIAAFMGTGILLLALSFAYQKASAYFQPQKDES